MEASQTAKTTAPSSQPMPPTALQSWLASEYCVLYVELAEAEEEGGFEDNSVFGKGLRRLLSAPMMEFTQSEWAVGGVCVKVGDQREKGREGKDEREEREESAVGEVYIGLQLVGRTDAPPNQQHY